MKTDGVVMLGDAIKDLTEAIQTDQLPMAAVVHLERLCTALRQIQEDRLHDAVKWIEGYRSLIQQVEAAGLRFRPQIKAKIAASESRLDQLAAYLRDLGWPTDDR